MFHRSSAEASIAGLLVGSPGVPFFGTTILAPLFGATSTVTVALMAIVVNVLQVPAATVLLEGSAAASAGTPPSATTPATGRGAQAPAATTNRAGIGIVVLSALRKPMVVAAVLAIVIVFLGIHIPTLIDTMLTPLGQATSGVAVFVAD